jgi:alpha-soluble NSF attachment protein
MSLCACYEGSCNNDKCTALVLAMLTYAQDSVTAKRNIQTYMSQDTTFASTRECKFLNAIMDAIQSEDQQAFLGFVHEYDQVTKLDNWKTMILLKIKNTIEGEPTIL